MTAQSLATKRWITQRTPVYGIVDNELGQFVPAVTYTGPAAGAYTTSSLGKISVSNLYLGHSGIDLSDHWGAGSAISEPTQSMLPMFWRDVLIAGTDAYAEFDKLRGRLNLVVESPPWLTDASLAIVLDAAPAESSAFGTAHTTLERLAQYADGWSGYESLAPVDQSVRLAHRFIDLLRGMPGQFGITPKLFAAGTAVLKVEQKLRGTTSRYTIEFLPEGALAANVDLPDSKHDYDLEGFDGSSIPEVLLRHFEAT